METGQRRLPTELQPEVELLLLCSRAAASAADDARIRGLVDAGPAWETLLALALEHGVWPQLYRRLGASSETGIPDRVRATLERGYELNARHNRFLLLELTQLLGRLSGHGVRAIPIKGPVLAVSGYGALADRTFGDLDILVSSGDFPRAASLLTSFGYERTKSFEWEASFVHPRIRIAIDLHRDIAHPGFSAAPAYDELWAQTELVHVDGNAIRVLSPAHNLLVLCVQLVSDWTAGQRKLAKLADVDVSVRAWKSPDWDALLRTARRLDARRILALGLLLPRRVLGTPLPESTARHVEAWAPSGVLAEDPTEALFRGGSPAPDLSERLAAYWHLRERPLRRLSYCVQIARDEIDRRGGSAASWPWPARILLHPWLRPAWRAWRLARRFGGTA